MNYLNIYNIFSMKIYLINNQASFKTFFSYLTVVSSKPSVFSSILLCTKSWILLGYPGYLNT